MQDRKHPVTSRLAAALALLGAAGATGAQDAAHTDLAPRAEEVETAPVTAVPPAETRAVDLAICLDTSGSMSGLIDSAKQKLWSIVNDLALAEPEPVLRVALLTYGNDGHDPESGWVRIDVPLTTDLDLISQRLFALGTNGGTELVGRVVDRATGSLEWSADPGALKLIVVAGNESADQDREVPFQEACKRAITAGVMINSIYCGADSDPIARGWEQVSRLADGHFATIDHDDGLVVVETPFDEELHALSVSVNDTYVPLGAAGREGWANQVAQDSNAAGLNDSAAASRAATKCSTLFRKGWDLVEACQAEDFDWSTLEDEDLPEEMRGLDLAGRKAYVASKRAERESMHAHMAELARKREAWRTAYVQLNGLDDSRAFDQALRGALRSQAESKGFRFRGGEPQEPSPEELERVLQELQAEAQAPAGTDAPEDGPPQEEQAGSGAGQHRSRSTPPPQQQRVVGGGGC